MMASDTIQVYLEKYTVTDLAADPVPIKVYKGSINEAELFGQSMQWAMEYLNMRECPSRLVEDVLTSIRTELCPDDDIAAANNNGSSMLREKLGFTLNGNPNEPLKLMQSVIKITDSVLMRLKESERYKTVAMTDVSILAEKMNGLGIGDEVDCNRNGSVIHSVSYFSMKNQRRTNEDRIVVYPSLNSVFGVKEPDSYFGVFDGHNGAEAAVYGAAQLHHTVIQNMKKFDDPKEAIVESFLDVDKMFCEKANNEQIRSGSAVVSAVINGSKLYVAWLGDSQAVLFHDNQINDLVIPHKPEREDERKRIETEGGEVILMNEVYRVNGNLAVSRSLGDTDFKNYISGKPDVIEFDLQEMNAEYLVLASDGLWDVSSGESVRSSVDKLILSNAMQDCARQLAFEAKSKNSGDNVSIIVVCLQSLETLKGICQARIDKDSTETIESGATLEIQQAIFDSNGVEDVSSMTFLDQMKPEETKLIENMTAVIENEASGAQLIQLDGIGSESVDDVEPNKPEESKGEVLGYFDTKGATDAHGIQSDNNGLEAVDEAEPNKPEVTTFLDQIQPDETKLIENMTGVIESEASCGAQLIQLDGIGLEGVSEAEPNKPEETKGEVYDTKGETNAHGIQSDNNGLEDDIFLENAKPLALLKPVKSEEMLSGAVIADPEEKPVPVTVTPVKLIPAKACKSSPNAITAGLKVDNGTKKAVSTIHKNQPIKPNLGSAKSPTAAKKSPLLTKLPALPRSAPGPVAKPNVSSIAAKTTDAKSPLGKTTATSSVARKLPMASSKRTDVLPQTKPNLKPAVNGQPTAEPKLTAAAKSRLPATVTKAPTTRTPPAPARPIARREVNPVTSAPKTAVGIANKPDSKSTTTKSSTTRPVTAASVKPTVPRAQTAVPATRVASSANTRKLPLTKDKPTATSSGTARNVPISKTVPMSTGAASTANKSTAPKPKSAPSATRVVSRTTAQAKAKQTGSPAIIPKSKEINTKDSPVGVKNDVNLLKNPAGEEKDVQLLGNLAGEEKEGKAFENPAGVENDVKISENSVTEENDVKIFKNPVTEESNFKIENPAGEENDMKIFENSFTEENDVKIFKNPVTEESNLKMENPVGEETN